MTMPFDTWKGMISLSIISTQASILPGRILYLLSS